MAETFTEESPILFQSLKEVPDSDEEEDIVADAESVDGSRAAFGACIKTDRADSEEKEKGRRFSHQLKILDSSKKHGLLKELQDGDELHYINEKDVTSWSHDAVMKTIQGLDKEIKFTFYRKSVKYIEHDLVKETDEQYIEVIFIISDLDSDHKASIDDILSNIKEVIVNFKDRVTYSERLIEPKFVGKKDVKVQHGAMKHDYLMVKNEKLVMQELKDPDQECCIFTMYSYSVIDEKEGCERFMVAIQCKKNRKFLMCRMGSQKLALVKDDNINEKMTKIAANSPCLFFLIEKDKRSYFESVAYPGNYLTYDRVDLLRVVHPTASPISPDFDPSDCVRRNFSFDIL